MSAKVRDATDAEQADGIAMFNDTGAEIVCIVARYADGSEIKFDPAILNWDDDEDEDGFEYGADISEADPADGLVAFARPCVIK